MPFVSEILHSVLTVAYTLKNGDNFKKNVCKQLWLQFQFVWIVFIYLKSLFCDLFFTFWKVYYSMEKLLALKSWVSDVWKWTLKKTSHQICTEYYSCIKQFSCINGIAPLYNLPCNCNSASPLWNSTVCMFIWLKHNDCGLFFLLFFLVKFMSARLEKCSTVYRLWHSVSSRCIRLLLPRMYIYN